MLHVRSSLQQVKEPPQTCGICGCRKSLLSRAERFSSDPGGRWRRGEQRSHVTRSTCAGGKNPWSYHIVSMATGPLLHTHAARPSLSPRTASERVKKERELIIMENQILVFRDGQGSFHNLKL
ncbi:hypothetical protein FQA47_015540 [Oryzias melastigma]|uniref:Uncharacterized protein n=1 Tax=Oryzias melastigma TaxID=30732 RepID=A0A834FQA1_ORYME|nr:hypothetical protein FQA47_015540 [Oryzias melastigma]